MHWKKLEPLLANPWVQSLKRPLQIGFTAAVVTAVVSLFMPNYYRSEARILPVEVKGGGGLGNLAAAAAAFGVGVPGSDGGDANFVDILNSRSLREKLLQAEFTFKQRDWRFGSEQLHKETLGDYLKAGNRDRGVASLYRIIGVSRDLKSKVITLTAETKSPELSQQIVHRTLGILEAFVQEKGRTRGGAKASFAESRLEEARKEMIRMEDDFRRFLDGNRNYLASADPSVRLRGMRLEAEFKLRQQLVTTLALSREQALMEEKNDMPILNILDPGHLPIDKSRPARSQFVVMLFLLSAGGGWAWLNRAWIKARLSEGDAQ